MSQPDERIGRCCMSQSRSPEGLARGHLRVIANRPARFSQPNPTAGIRGERRSELMTDDGRPGGLVVAVDEPGPRRPAVGAPGTAAASGGEAGGGGSTSARVADGSRKRRVRSLILARYSRRGHLRWALMIVLGVVLALSKLTSSL
jgi:hypothetical protein